MNIEKYIKGVLHLLSMKEQTQTNTTEISNALLEIRGILRMLSENSGQSIATPKRLMELNNFLKELEIGFKHIKVLK